MGQYTSSLKALVTGEFRRLKGSKSYLTFDDLVSLQLSGCNYKVDPIHLPTLYLLDDDKDGRFSLKDLMKFVDYVGKELNMVCPAGFAYDLQALATEQVLHLIGTYQGKEQYVDWGITMVIADQPTNVCAKHPDIQLVKSTAAVALHQLLKVGAVQDLDWPAFLELLHKVADAHGMMDLERTDKDDWVPVPVLRMLISSAADGMLGFANQVFG